MLYGLGHNTFVRGDDQHEQDQCPPAPASIFLMNFSWPGTSTIPACVPSGQSRSGKARLDGDAPALLLRQPVGVRAGQRLDQNGFAVIHMAGGADDAVFHDAGSPRKARTISSKIRRKEGPQIQQAPVMGNADDDGDGAAAAVWASSAAALSLGGDSAAAKEGSVWVGTAPPPTGAVRGDRLGGHAALARSRRHSDSAALAQLLRRSGSAWKAPEAPEGRCRPS